MEDFQNKINEMRKKIKNIKSNIELIREKNNTQEKSETPNKNYNYKNHYKNLFTNNNNNNHNNNLTSIESNNTPNNNNNTKKFFHNYYYNNNINGIQRRNKRTFRIK